MKHKLYLKLYYSQIKKKNKNIFLKMNWIRIFFHVIFYPKDTKCIPSFLSGISILCIPYACSLQWRVEYFLVRESNYLMIMKLFLTI